MPEDETYKSINYSATNTKVPLTSSLNLKINLKYLLLILLLASCTGNEESDTTPPPLYPQPQKVELNIGTGYTLNTFTGDSIRPIILESGDTLITGVPIPAKGKLIHRDSVAKPKVVSAVRPDHVYNAHPNVHQIPNDLTVIPVNKDSLTTILLKEIAKNDTSHYLITNTGDTLKTGVPIPAKGKLVPTVQPRSTPALPPRSKDAAATNLRYLDVDQGMASSYVTSMIEDKNGNLWFGTFGGGVSKYDGHSFTHYTNKEGLPDNRIWCMIEDKSGNLWFGTNGGGVSKYDGRSFTHFTEKEGLSNNTVISMVEDQSGNLWFGTFDGGVIEYDGQSFTHFTEKEGLSNNTVQCIMEDQSGNLWFGTVGGVSKYDGRSFTYYTDKEGLSNNIVISMLEDNSGNLWFGTEGGGVCKYDGHRFTHFTEKEGLTNNIVMSIIEDKSVPHGEIWFGTFGGGVSKYDGHSFTHYTEKEGLSKNTIWSIIQDKSGNLWFATNGGGVDVLNSASFTHFTEKEGLSSNTVLSIIEDKSGNLWFGTSGGGVSRYDDIFFPDGQAGFTHFTEKEGLSNNRVLSIIEDRSGNLWFGTNAGGVNKYDGHSFTHYTEEEGLCDNSVYSIIEDRSGNLWFATGGGVSKYDGRSFTHYTKKEGLCDNSVYSIMEDRGGNLWFGTRGGGVSRYDGRSFTHFTEKEGLSNNRVMSILEDESRNIWFVTDGGGVSKYDGRSFTHFTEEAGLSSNLAWSIIEDKSGNLWVSTENGLDRIVATDGVDSQPQNNKKTTDVTYELFRYGKNDGLKGTDFLSKSVCLDSKNRIWWGSSKSLTMQDLNKFKTATQPPQPHLKAIDINEEFVDYRNIPDELKNEVSFNGVQPFENYPLNLELPYDRNHLTFHFVAIDWYAPHKIQYSYLMEGLNKEWSVPSKEPKADYRNLPYGAYTFKIRAIGESGQWSEPFEYTFTIHPPWWHTWWARAGYGILAVLVLIGTVRWRTATLRKRQIELETEVDMATKEIREQKEEIEAEKERSENLLLNILPEEIAEELKEKGHSDAQHIDEVTVLFTDFKGFTALSEKVTPKELVQDLHECFSAFDHICEKYGIEKIKTIGDAYMAAGGLPSPNTTHARDVVNAALEMREFVEKGKQEKIVKGLPFFEVRIGVHTGPVVAGIVGVKKFQYDIWGDTVNTASRMESSGEVGKVNISEATYKLLKDDAEFSFENRGKITAKGKGEMEMYFVNIEAGGS